MRARKKTILSHKGPKRDALAAFDRTLAIDPTIAQAWSHRGGVLKDLGRSADAADSYRQALAAGGDADLNGYYLAALTGEGAPARSLVSVLGWAATTYLLGCQKCTYSL